jgi:NhaP-type Na+/H+ or K+/H+ antiporter
VLGWLIFGLPNRSRISRTGDGFVALGATCLAYGVTEMAHAYGFIAVFVAALHIRDAERTHQFNETLHGFMEQLERLLMMALLVLFGGALAAGRLFGALTWESVIFAGLAIFAVRPVVCWIALPRSIPLSERAVISFFGIRGLGTAYYLAYALNHGTFERPDLLWSVAGLIILMSILIHGTTVTPIMNRLDRNRGADIMKKSADGTSRAMPT